MGSQRRSTPDPTQGRTRWERVLAKVDAWAARPRPARRPGSQIHRAARDVTGATGLATQRVWDSMVEGHRPYLKSFEPRIPPSAFVSEADVLRRGEVMPLSERCLEDLGRPQDAED